MLARRLIEPRLASISMRRYGFPLNADFSKRPLTQINCPPLASQLTSGCIDGCRSLNRSRISKFFGPDSKILKQERIRRLKMWPQPPCFPEGPPQFEIAWGSANGNSPLHVNDSMLRFAAPIDGVGCCRIALLGHNSLSYRSTLLFFITKTFRSFAS